VARALRREVATPARPILLCHVPLCHVPCALCSVPPGLSPVRITRPRVNPPPPIGVKLGKVCVDTRLGNVAGLEARPLPGARPRLANTGCTMSVENGTQTNVNWSDKRIFTTGEAADVCKVSQQTIIRCFDSGRLGGFRVPGSKFRRIPRADLIKFMRENDIPTEILEGGPRRVLVVDDDPQIVEMFKDLLSKDATIDVRSASTGYEAGLLTESFRPHLIILDYMLPDINGNIVCQRLREREEFKETRILFVSGVVDAKEIEQLKAAGADDFIRKPFDVSSLMTRVREMLPA
jgi:excisionase family DNA binding protein